MRPELSFEAAAARLRGNEPVLVAVRDEERLRQVLGTNAPTLHEVAAWPTAGAWVAAWAAALAFSKS